MSRVESSVTSDEPVFTDEVPFESRTGHFVFVTVEVAQGRRPRLAALRIESPSADVRLDGDAVRSIAGEVRHMTNQAAGWVRMNATASTEDLMALMAASMTSSTTPSGDSVVKVNTRAMADGYTKAEQGRANARSEYEECARVYLRAAERQKTKAVREHFGLPTNEAARQMIMRTRRHGYLPPAEGATSNTRGKK